MKDVFSGIEVTPAGTPAAAAKPAPESMPGIPISIQFPLASGHLVVPIFELSDGAARGSVLVREVRCTHNGLPVWS